MDTYREIREVLGEEMASYGIDIGAWGVTATLSADGGITVRRGRHPSEGIAQGLSTELDESRTLRENMHLIAATLDRLIRRDRTLTEQGLVPSRPPAWAQVADLTIMGILDRAGVVRGDMTQPRIGGERESRILTRLQQASFSDSEVNEANGFGYRTRAHVEKFSYGGTLWIADNTGTPVVAIARTIPATIATALQGRPLDDAIDHPITNGLGAVIADMEERSMLTLIRLEPRLAPLAEAPEGVDTSWLIPVPGERLPMGFP